MYIKVTENEIRYLLNAWDKNKAIEPICNRLRKENKSGVADRIVNFVPREMKQLPRKPDFLEPIGHRNEPILETTAARQVEAIIDEWNQKEFLAEKSLFPISTVLLHGPPGTGKTITAKHIATRAGMEVVRLNMAQLIASHLGETGRNLDSALSWCFQTGTALIIDEIDAVTETRGGEGNAGQEMSRVVACLLGEMDAGKTPPLFIGTTNRLDSMDPAILRRFHAQISIAPPNEEQKSGIVYALLGRFTWLEDLQKAAIARAAIDRHWDKASDLETFVLTSLKSLALGREAEA